MIRKLKLLIIWFLIVSSAQAQNSKEQIYELKSGNLIMKVSSMGGRILSLSCCGKEILTQATEHENFGATLWTAPQSDWGWPPFAVLDVQEYQVTKKKNYLKMTSMPDQKSGLQIIKTWKSEGHQKVEIEYQIKNISDRPKSVGAWDVSRVPCGGLSFYPEGGEGKVPESNLKIDLQKEGINWISIDKAPIEDHEKLFSTAKDGWLAYVLNGMLFIKQFPDTKPENYSPQHGEVEIYINKEKSYIELENHGSYQLLKPGESLTYQENWFLLPVSKSIKSEAGNQALTSLVRTKINDK